MVLAVLPKRLPTLEPHIDALQTALEEKLADALANVNSRFVQQVPLEYPKKIRTALITAFQQVTAWPTVTITSRGPSCISSDEQGGIVRWQGTIDVDVYLQNTNIDELSKQLSRYVAAFWLVIAQLEYLAGADIDFTSMDMEQAATSNDNAAQRAAGLSFNIGFTS